MESRAGIQFFRSAHLLHDALGPGCSGPSAFVTACEDPPFWAGEAVLMEVPLECGMAFHPGHWARTIVLTWCVAWGSGSVYITLSELHGHGDKTYHSQGCTQQGEGW